jgi:prepilin-type N-terminal cleavage/methylation domain-containing protein
MNTPRRPGHSRLAFTLIELLVVISILAILAAASVPVIGIVKQSANSAKSLSNMRQIGAAMTAYQADKGRYPAIDGETPIEGMDNWAAELVIILNPDEDLEELIEDPPTGIFVSPGIDWKDPASGGRFESHDIFNTYSATDTMVGFDYNDKLDEKRGRRPDAIQNKPQTIMMVEGKQSGAEPRSIGWIEWSTAKSDLSGDADQSKAVDFRYRERVNALMADFSAKSLGKKKNTSKIVEAEWQGYDYRDRD